MARIIEIDPKAGFCFGVEKAIDEAEKQLDQGNKVLGLGHMVHNEEEIGRLEALGLETIGPEVLSDQKGKRVILRAHGEPPSSYEIAKLNNVEIIDMTCPIVSKLQKKIRKTFESMDHSTEQIVIFGKKDHPETIGLLGQTDGKAVLITDPNDIDKLDISKSIHLFSQTTMDPDNFKLLETNISKQIKAGSSTVLNSNCTICGQMKQRKPNLKNFAQKHDVILFVSGKKSSNGAMLYNYCKKVNKNTFWVHSSEDIDPGWLMKDGSIGISGATSTPRWQLEKIRDRLKALSKD